MSLPFLQNSYKNWHIHPYTYTRGGGGIAYSIAGDSMSLPFLQNSYKNWHIHPGGGVLRISSDEEDQTGEKAKPQEINSWIKN